MSQRWNAWFRKCSTTHFTREICQAIYQDLIFSEVKVSFLSSSKISHELGKLFRRGSRVFWGSVFYPTFTQILNVVQFERESQQFCNLGHPRVLRDHQNRLAARIMEAFPFFLPPPPRGRCARPNVFFEGGRNTCFFFVRTGDCKSCGSRNNW